jgi:hypothetical protein
MKLVEKELELDCNCDVASELLKDPEKMRLEWKTEKLDRIVQSYQFRPSPDSS